MKDKTPLTLMELVIMLAVFALAAALCLHAFVWADTQSRHNQDRSNALLLAQNTAELVKHHRGDLSLVSDSAQRDRLETYFDADWQQVAANGVFTLTVTKNPAQALLGSAQITVTGEQDIVLASLDIAWQEVAQ